MPAPDLPRSLRRAASRAGKPSQRLLDAAEIGLLTRGNTQPGTAGRRAVDRVSYVRRREAEPTLPPREAAGHRVAGSGARVVTFYTADPPRRITLQGEGVTLRDVKRGGVYLHGVRTLIAELRRHPDQAERIKRRWESQVRRRAPIAGYPLLATATAAIALADQDRQSGEDPVFDSGRSRPGRRRRRPSRRHRP